MFVSNTTPEDTTMKTRIVLFVAVAALATPALGEGVKNPLKEPYFIYQKAAEWDMFHSMRAVLHERMPMPEKHSVLTDQMLLAERHTYLASDQMHSTWSWNTSTPSGLMYTPITFGVPGYRLTNHFVKNQSGPAPIHAEKSATRKI